MHRRHMTSLIPGAEDLLLLRQPFNATTACELYMLSSIAAGVNPRTINDQCTHTENAKYRVCTSSVNGAWSQSGHNAAKHVQRSIYCECNEA